MALAIALITTSTDFSRRKKKLRVKGTVSGNYTQGAANNVLDLTTITNPQRLSNGLAGSNPERGVVLNSPDGYRVELTKGATQKTWELQVFTSGGAELAAGAFPAAFLADPIQFEFEGSKGAF